jgi:hypothetical protein
MVEFIKVYKDGDCWGAFTRENLAEGLMGGEQP